MKREFYMSGKRIGLCANCYFDAPHCLALRGVTYSSHYNRSEDCDKVDICDPKIDRATFVNLLRSLRLPHDSMCCAENQHPIPLIHYTTIMFSPFGIGRKCQQSIRNGTKDELCGCAILAVMKKHGIGYRITKKIILDWVNVELFGGQYLQENLWLWEPLYLHGLCMGCQWHQKCYDGPYYQYSRNTEFCKSYISQDKCPAKAMREDGYSPYEAYVKCLACHKALAMQITYMGKINECFC